MLRGAHSSQCCSRYLRSRRGADGNSAGRLFQLATYILTIALFSAIVGAFGNWRNSPAAYWLNLCAVGGRRADGIWALVVVPPGYVPVLLGLTPPAIFVLAAALTTIARRRKRCVTPPARSRSLPQRMHRKIYTGLNTRVPFVSAILPESTFAPANMIKVPDCRDSHYILRMFVA
jgi:hypothetical protein